MQCLCDMAGSVAIIALQFLDASWSHHTAMIDWPGLIGEVEERTQRRGSRRTSSLSTQNVSDLEYMYSTYGIPFAIDEPSQTAGQLARLVC